MVSSTLCPAVHILGSQNVYGGAEGIADHYWPWAVFFFIFLTKWAFRLKPLKVRALRQCTRRSRSPWAVESKGKEMRSGGKT